MPNFTNPLREQLTRFSGDFNLDQRTTTGPFCLMTETIVQTETSSMVRQVEMMANWNESLMLWQYKHIMQLTKNVNLTPSKVPEVAF